MAAREKALSPNRRGRCAQFTDFAQFTHQADYSKEFGVKVHYLEIVAADLDAVGAAYEAALGVKFGSSEPLLGGARTAPLPNGGSIGVRGPLRDTEEPVVRPYWLVDDITAALDAATKQGAFVAHPPLEIPGKGTFAIYTQGGVDHGLWQL